MAINAGLFLHRTPQNGRMRSTSALHSFNVSNDAGAYPGLGVFLLPPDGMSFHHRVTPNILW